MKTLPAGKYYIGDCCYVLKSPDYDWMEFCSQFFADGESITINKTPIVAYNTLYGDGNYSSNIGATFPVDAGLIGIMPKKLWKGEGTPFDCTLVEFKDEFVCSKAEDGTLTFGHVVIETGDSEEDEEE